MASIMSSVATAFLIALMIIGNNPAIVVVNGVSCSDAVTDLIPCGSYLTGSGGPNPSPQCCAGAERLNQLAGTRADRQSVCQCLKQSGPSFGVNPNRAKQLPTLCNLKLSIPITPDVDCSKV